MEYMKYMVIECKRNVGEKQIKTTLIFKKQTATTKTVPGVLQNYGKENTKPIKLHAIIFFSKVGWGWGAENFRYSSSGAIHLCFETGSLTSNPWSK